MSTSWPEQPIQDLCLFAVDCVNRTAPVVDHETPYKMIRTTNVKGGFIDVENVRNVSEETYVRWTRRLVPKRGDVVLTREAPLGDVGRITTDDKVFLGQRLFHYRANPELLDGWFLAYVLQSPRVQGKIRGYGFGATVEHVKVKDCLKIPIPVPPIETQARIASVLAAYDDLIENHRRRIPLLEEAARLLYREWFVHFRFPGNEHVKIIDGIPEGWSNTPMVELVEMVMGQSPKSEFYNTIGEGLPFHQGVTNYGVRFVSDVTYSTKITKLAETGDILFSVRAPVGRINVTLNRMVVGRGLAAFRSRTSNQSFLLYQLKNHFFKEDLIGGGAIYAATNKKELEKLELLQPTDELVEAFEQFSVPIDAQIQALSLEIDQLMKARDILLPRLMDGRIEI